MTNLRRVFGIASGAALVLLLSAAVAAADDLEDFLEGAAEASYAGQQATYCSYAGSTEFSVVTVEHAGAMVMVESGGTSQLLGGGRVSAPESGNGLALADWSSVDLVSRYTTGSVEPQIRIGRDVQVVTVKEDNKIRARIWFDTETGAALGAEVYDGSGELFRLSWLIDFDPNPRRIFTAMRGSESVYDVVAAAEADTVPTTLSGYELVDTYAGPAESTHGFYSDGLFSFSLFVIEGEGEIEQFADANTLNMATGSYRWILTPSDMWVQWSGGGMSYILAGDLPPDHLESVLTELPAPSKGNILSRIWNGIFG